MLSITFARHGQNESSDLNAQGIQQAQLLGDILKSQKGRDISVVSSPITRAFQTARIIAKNLDVGLSVRRDLQLDSSQAHLEDKNAVAIIEQYRRKFQQLPKLTRDVVVVTHQSNVIGFGMAFAEAVNGKYYAPETGGAVSYEIDANHWTDAMSCLESRKGVKISMVHRCLERKVA